jgi:hypothetical protein
MKKKKKDRRGGNVPWDSRSKACAEWVLVEDKWYTLCDTGKVDVIVGISSGKH